MEFRPFKAYTAPSRDEEYPPVPEVTDETPVGIELTDTVTEDTEYRETLDFPDQVEPQPVVIVEPNAKKPYVNHAFFQTFILKDLEPIQVLGNYYGRRTIYINNSAGSDIFLSGQQQMWNRPTMFELSPSDKMTLYTTDPIWAMSQDSRISIIVEIED